MAEPILSFGGGTNSTAVLIGLHERQQRPSAIVFADTGGEKPRTYAHLLRTQRWLESVSFPSITIVRGNQPRQQLDGSLEAECLRLGTLPSRAMGFGSCSDKWKVDPFEKWLKAQAYAEPTIMIGYHAGESERATRRERYGKPCRYPLIEWDWGPEECEAAVRRAGLRAAGKSACFFCPASKAREIMALRRLHPTYMARALAMEARALAGEGPAPALRSCKGLGRRFAWVQLLREHDAQPDLFSQTPEECGEGCFT